LVKLKRLLSWSGWRMRLISHAENDIRYRRVPAAAAGAAQAFDGLREETTPPHAAGHARPA